MTKLEEHYKNLENIKYEYNKKIREIIEDKKINLPNDKLYLFENPIDYCKWKQENEEEYNKFSEWIDNNREFHKELIKLVYSKNSRIQVIKDRIRSYENYQNNKEKFKAKGAEKIECKICGINLRKDTISRHKKSKKHFKNEYTTQ